jgi:hypothetical protein
VNSVIVTLHDRGMGLTIRDGRLRVEGATDESQVADVLPALRARRAEFERRTRWATGVERRYVWSALRGERIAVGKMDCAQTAAHVKRGDIVQYDTVELALIAGLSREKLLLIHAVKRVMGGMVMNERRES